MPSLNWVDLSKCYSPPFLFLPLSRPLYLLLPSFLFSPIGYTPLIVTAPLRCLYPPFLFRPLQLFFFAPSPSTDSISSAVSRRYETTTIFSCVLRDSTPRFVRPSIRPSVGLSVGRSHFTLLLLPKWSRDLKYGPCPLWAMDWARWLLGYLGEKFHLCYMAETI